MTDVRKWKTISARRYFIFLFFYKWVKRKKIHEYACKIENILKVRNYAGDTIKDLNYLNYHTAFHTRTNNLPSLIVECRRCNQNSCYGKLYTYTLLLFKNGVNESELKLQYSVHHLSCPLLSLLDADWFKK